MKSLCSYPSLRSERASAARHESLGDAAAVVPLLLHSTTACPTAQPITLGVPLPRGFLHRPEDLSLHGALGTALLQTEVLARWSDGSIKWLLLDFVPDSGPQGVSAWSLIPSAPGATPSPPLALTVRETGQAVVDTGVAVFHLDTSRGFPLRQVALDGRDILDADACRLVLTDKRGRPVEPEIESATFETRGPVRATLRVQGRFGRGAPCRFVARLCFFAGTGLVRCRLTLHNPRRARHPGGLWDLGDAGSVLFRDLAVQLRLTRARRASKDTLACASGSEEGDIETAWTTEPGQPSRLTRGSLEIYQDSSGGDNWLSPNHVNRHGQVPCTFCGYRVRTAEGEEFGRRASPVVCVRAQTGTLSAALPEFWQQFPRAIESDSGVLRLGLFPRQHGDLFELQGGEQKTHTFWLHFGRPDSAGGALDWVHSPARARSTPEWYARSGVFPHLLPATTAPHPQLDAFLTEALEGDNNLFARREAIDEYGWRHFGEVHADHEAEHYDGPPPLISHYNNQYDLLGGAIVQYLRTGDGRWFDLFDPLARHVTDIDIYHTSQDRAAYNGGLFWFTDHYKTAATCTHRTYSRANCRAGDRSYGGGPSSNHNFTTGLLLYHLLTGDPGAREAVLSLADWVMNLDDGRQTILGLIDDGPTGLASCTATSDYHGPGRGAGNSVNALLDAWALTGQSGYLQKAEQLIRRCIHPADDVPGRDLLNVEKRWSYTVFLVALAKYLDLKAEAGELDRMYAHARAGLLHYAAWMVENEVPYFDHPDKLEYPTEAWAGQEFRKANVLRLAAAHADEPLRSRLLRRGQELADRAWSDLQRFASRTSARGVALVLAEGSLDASARVSPPKPAPRPDEQPEFGTPEVFVPQKRRVLARLRTARGLLRALLGLANPWNWRALWRARSR
ncbi:MAG: hypothetical protein L0Z62_48550 [Gemmataceae bacterium]|nr:hypothetical protein [Gemmataceae bacterium]